MFERVPLTKLSFATVVDPKFTSLQLPPPIEYCSLKSFGPLLELFCLDDIEMLEYPIVENSILQALIPEPLFQPEFERE